MMHASRHTTSYRKISGWMNNKLPVKYSKPGKIEVMSNNVFFTSDLHLGHQMIARTRCFNSMDEHDGTLVENINQTVPKRSKLYILGDLAFSRNGLQWAKEIKCDNIELILGNHDMYPLTEYLKIATKIHGFRKYKTFWLSHCPIHPNELRDMDGNIHGHVHHFSDTTKIEDPRYINVNTEFHKHKPITFEAIQEQLKNVEHN